MLLEEIMTVTFLRACIALEEGLPMPHQGLARQNHLISVDSETMLDQPVHVLFSPVIRLDLGSINSEDEVAPRATGGLVDRPRS